MSRSRTFPSVFIFFFLFSTLIHANSPSNDSWEFWLNSLKNKKAEPAPRPDSKHISLELPLWVDCHISWHVDRSPEKISLPEGLVLQSSPELCKTQMENWAQP